MPPEGFLSMKDKHTCVQDGIIYRLGEFVICEVIDGGYNPERRGWLISTNPLVMVTLAGAFFNVQSVICNAEGGYLKGIHHPTNYRTKEFREEVIGYLLRGHKVQAIKSWRVWTNDSLKDAKYEVDALEWKLKVLLDF